MKNVEYTLNSPINCSISINAAPNIRIRTSTDAAPATAITSAIPLLPPQPTKVRSISILKKWDELELIYGEALRQCVCGVIEVSAKPDEADRSLRHLLGFLATQAGLSDSAFAAPIIAALIGKRDPNFADPQYVQAIASARAPAERRQANANAWPSRIRGPARHGDLLPLMPLEMARDRRRARTQ